MNYELTDAQKIIQSGIAKFCREELAGNAADLDGGTKEEVRSRLRDNLKKLANAGYLDLLLGDDIVMQCVAGEEVAKACPATFLCAMSSLTSFGVPVKLFGTTAQKSRYLDALRNGELVGCLGCTEADGGCDLGGLQTHAEMKGGRWVITGVKNFVTNAPLADAFLILAWTDQSIGLEKGLSMFLIDKGTPGLTVGQPLETMGLRGALASEVSLQRCEVGNEALLGGEGSGYAQLNRTMDLIKLAVSSMSIGIGVCCMEISTAYGKTRKAFGKPIGVFEGVGAKLAVMFTLNDLGRMMTHRAAWGIEQGQADCSVLSSCAKLFTSESVNQIADLAMQIHGGHGYIKGMDVERLYRDARFAVIAHGTSEMQRTFIARDSLNKFKPL